MVRLAVLHTGALHANTLRYACHSVNSAQQRGRHWTSALLTVAVYWNPGPRLDQCARFDRELVLGSASLVEACRTPPHSVSCHQEIAWVALELAVGVALAWRADWTFRVRFDTYVPMWEGPDAYAWNVRCAYVFRQAWGWPSDNVLLMPIGAAVRLFNRSHTLPLGEQAVAATVAALQMDLCWLHVEVWLLKPERSSMGNTPGSTGIRRWTTPIVPSNEPAASFDASINVKYRAKHITYANYADAPLKAVTGNGLS